MFSGGRFWGGLESMWSIFLIATALPPTLRLRFNLRRFPQSRSHWHRNSWAAAEACNVDPQPKAVAQLLAPSVPPVRGLGQQSPGLALCCSPLQREAATTARKGYCPARIHGKYLRPMCQLLEDSSLKQACHALLVANSGGSLLVCAGAQLQKKSCNRNHWASRFLPSIAWGCRFSHLCDKYAAHECTSMPSKADAAWALLSWPEFVRGTAAPALKRSSLWTSIHNVFARASLEGLCLHCSVACLRHTGAPAAPHLLVPCPALCQAAPVAFSSSLGGVVSLSLGAMFSRAYKRAMQQ